MERIMIMYLKQFYSFLSLLLQLESIRLLGIIPGLANLTLNQFAPWLKYTFFLKHPKRFPNRIYNTALTILQACYHYFCFCYNEFCHMQGPSSSIWLYFHPLS